MPTTVSEMAAAGLIHANPLTNLKEKIRAHWAEFRPKMYADLQNSGKLESALEAAEAQTVEAVLGAMQPPKPLRLHEAFELFATEWAYLPSEEEQPELGRDPGEWQMPDVPEDE